MECNFRTLNYLGSKYRLLDFIEANIIDITPVGMGVCDLFAGSGCVSRKLSCSYPVTSCDIQSYSKVLSNALLNKFEVTEEDISKFIQALDTESANLLKEAYSPLIQIETEAINNKNLEILACVLEHGSLEVFDAEHFPSIISEFLYTTINSIKHSDLWNERSLISRYYGGVFFSYRQAVEIDIILEGIHRLISAEKRDLFLAALLSTASDVVNTVGKHFAQPLKARDSEGKIKSTVYTKAAKDKTINVLDLYKDWLLKYTKLQKNDLQHKTIQGDFETCLNELSESVKTIYADPPYTRDHYSRFYHVLETITLRDSPEISKVTVHGSTHLSNGIYREDRHQSPFCIKSKASEAFRKLFEISSSSNRNLILSYSPYNENVKSHPRVVTMQQLEYLAKECFGDVQIVSAGSFKHNKLNSTEHFLDASDEAEMLFVCTNNH